ncbi:MAG: hypothetical protein RLZ13_1589 [Bacteroidota bacterium]
MDAILSQKITAQGKQIETVQMQLASFKQGFPFLSLVAPATPARGIQVWSDSQVKDYQSYFEKRASELELVKFVPASGAASRMFKDLFSFLERDGNELDGFTQKFISQLHQFAFCQDLDALLQQQGESIASLLEKKDYKKLVASLLTNAGLGYGNLPKGLLRFHAYADENRCPAEEHLVEGIQYGVGKNNQVQIHFTVSPEHEAGFISEIHKHLPKLQQQSEVEFKVSFSHQKKSTDTIAVDALNAPFLEEDGSLLFRPAGHGALLENLNEISADLIFIKNIDNVVPDRLKPITQTYKMALAGWLLEVQARIFQALIALDLEISSSSVQFAMQVYSTDLGGIVPESIQEGSLNDQATFFKTKLNRPIRVCGMVKNTGEPGGGPFWIHEKDGTQSLQILETAQIDTSNPESLAHLQASTHFNPVDLVCATRDYKGNAFDLLQYRDMNTGFITEKSKSGKVLKALELPGLWNGAMADWNTLFVEVPILTFNPVKTSNDLLRPEHQA